jgi:hypothetical protein
MDGWQRKEELLLENQEVRNKENIEVLLAQWQTCVEMANAVSERRDNMNNLFVTVNLALRGADIFCPHPNPFTIRLSILMVKLFVFIRRHMIHLVI